MADMVRLVFISGPSCVICLRGMDDLNRALVASIQEDPRIHTLVLQVPALGAQEKHAAAAIPLMPGPHAPNTSTAMVVLAFFADDLQWLLIDPTPEGLRE